MSGITIKIDNSDLKAMVNANELKGFLEQAMQDTINDIFVDLTSSPPVGTPVDQGSARNSWQIDISDPLHPEVYSTSPYMGALNMGHSKQSPEGFIDAIVDKHSS